MNTNSYEELSTPIDIIENNISQTQFNEKVTRTENSEQQVVVSFH